MTQQQKNDTRAAKCTIVLGFNGTGKTTYLRNTLLALWTQAHRRGERLKILVITPDDAEWTQFEENTLMRSDDFVWDGIMRHIWNDQHTPDILEYYKNGIIVFDDCRCYFKDNLDPRITELLIRRRQRAVDVFAVGHGFTTVPPKFFTYYSDAVLFKTVDNIDRRKDCITNFDYFKRKQAEVNERSKRDAHYHIRIKNTDI